MSLRCTTLCLVALLAARAGAEEVIPPSPTEHFNDYASIVSPATAEALNAKLEQFERDTSSQILVVIYPTMKSDSSVEDYTVRVAQSWHVGVKGKDNGAVLFIFAQTHKLFIQVGYGLEGALPDALAKRIIDDEIVPRFHSGDYDGGVTAGVNAIMAATRGEYHGTGRSVHGTGDHGLSTVALLFFFLVIVVLSIFRRAGAVYHSGGRGTVGGFVPFIFPGGGGGFGGGGGGGFSGGGGSFGGGGAGGSW